MTKPDDRDPLGGGMAQPVSGESAFLTGRFLVAMPRMDDTRFAKAVILICSHDDEHAMGITINRGFDGLGLGEVLGGLEIPDADRVPDFPLVQGGPVGPERGFVIHSPDFELAGATLTVNQSISLTATREALNALTSQNPPQKALLALGCAGWGPGQLERELTQAVWMVTDARDAIVFDPDHAHKWERALATLGIAPHQLHGGIGNA
jgi:putative transcriptional regulator